MLFWPISDMCYIKDDVKKGYLLRADVVGVASISVIFT